MNIPIHKILPNPMQPRKDFDPKELQELADSIVSVGIIQPIVVEEYQPGVYTLIDGERRLRASKLAGLKEIPAEIRERSADDEQRLILASIANLQRSDLTVIEEAQIYKYLKTTHGYSDIEVSVKVGRSSSTVAARMRLLEQPSEIQAEIGSKRFSHDLKAIDAIERIKDVNIRIQFVRAASENPMTVKQIVAAVDSLLKTNPDLEVNSVRTLGRPSEGKTNGQKPFDPHQRAITLAENRQTRDAARWNMLEHLGKLPPWELVREAAIATCKRCELADMASEKIHANCQAVDMLVEMLKR